MGPHGNGRQRSPAALFLLLGLTAALAYFHDDVAVFSLRLRAGRSIKQELTENVARLEKLAKKFGEEVAFFTSIKKDYAAAKGSDKKKQEQRFDDWMAHCTKRRREVSEAKKAAKSSLQDAKNSKKPEDNKEAAAAEPKVTAARELVKKTDAILSKLRSAPL